MVDEIYQNAKEKMDKAITHFQSELTSVRTGRASTSLLDNIMIEFYGTTSPLKNIALISAPDAQLITVQPYDPNALEAIEKAISSSDIGINPNNDGNIIRLSVPPLTEERRKDLVKLVHSIIEDGRISIRNIRRDANEKLKLLEKSHDISEDNLKIELDNIQEITDDYIKKLNNIQDLKEKDILL